MLANILAFALSALSAYPIVFTNTSALALLANMLSPPVLTFFWFCTWCVCADRWLTFFAALSSSPVLAYAAPAAFRTQCPQRVMFANRATTAGFARGPYLVVLTDATAAAFLAMCLLPAVFTKGAPSAVLAH